MIDLQPGPCTVCGLTNYPLSVGGPSICPACDCGNYGPATVNAQRLEIERLQTMERRMKRVAHWADNYDGDIAGAILAVLSGNAAEWDSDD